MGLRAFSLYFYHFIHADDIESRSCFGQTKWPRKFLDAGYVQLMDILASRGHLQRRDYTEKFAATLSDKIFVFLTIIQKDRHTEKLTDLLSCDVLGISKALDLTAPGLR